MQTPLPMRRNRKRMSEHFLATLLLFSYFATSIYNILSSFTSTEKEEEFFFFPVMMMMSINAVAAATAAADADDNVCQYLQVPPRASETSD